MSLLLAMPVSFLAFATSFTVNRFQGGFEVEDFFEASAGFRKSILCIVSESFLDWFCSKNFKLIFSNFPIFYNLVTF